MIWNLVWLRMLVCLYLISIYLQVKPSFPRESALLCTPLPRAMNSFDLIQFLIIVERCFCTYVLLIALMLVNLFVLNVNVFVNSCNVLNICK